MFFSYLIYLYSHASFFAEKHSYGDGTLSPDYLEVDPIQTQKEVDNGSESYDDVDQLHTDTEDYDDVGERQTVLHV